MNNVLRSKYASGYGEKYLRLHERLEYVWKGIALNALYLHVAVVKVHPFGGAYLRRYLLLHCHCIRFLLLLASLLTTLRRRCRRLL